MRSDGGQSEFFLTSLEDQTEPTLGEIAESAVNEPTGPAAGTEGKVNLLYQGCLQP